MRDLHLDAVPDARTSSPMVFSAPMKLATNGELGWSKTSLGEPILRNLARIHHHMIRHGHGLFAIVRHVNGCETAACSALP